MRSFISTSGVVADSNRWPKSIKDKNGVTAVDLIASSDEGLKEIFRHFQKQASYSRGDIAHGKCSGPNTKVIHLSVADSDDDDGEPGSGSDSD